MSRLVVSIDGVNVPEDEARRYWERFSAYMEEHKGDFDGFAKANGFRSAQPEYLKGKAVLKLMR